MNEENKKLVTVLVIIGIVIVLSLFFITQGKYIVGQVAYANYGCCLEEEGYCLDNYPQGKCSGKFIQNSCRNYLGCVMAPEKGSLLGSTGYPVLFTQKDYLNVE